MARADEVFALARSALTGDQEHARSNEPERSALSALLRQLLQTHGGRHPTAGDGIRLDKGIETLVRVVDVARDVLVMQPLRRTTNR